MEAAARKQWIVHVLDAWAEALGESQADAWGSDELVTGNSAGASQLSEV